MNMAWLTAGLLGGWLLISIVAQFVPKRLNDWIRKWDTFSLIPRWSFFAPNPGTSDYFLLVRYRQENGELTAWQEVAAGDRRKLKAALWNPNKRKHKVISDAVSSFGYLAGDMDKGGIQSTMPYLVLLQFVRERPSSPWMAAIQFMVMERREEQSRMSFRSAFHRLSPTAA